MSLIVQTLNRLKGSSKRKPVPPGLGSRKPERNGEQKLIIYGGIIILLVAFLSILLLNREKLLYPDRTNLLVEREAQPVVKAEKKEVAQPKTVETEEKPVLQRTEAEEKPQPVKTVSREEKPAPKIQAVERPAVKKTRPENKKTENKSTEHLYTAYLHQGNTYLKSKEYGKSLYYYKKALAIKKDSNLLKNIILLKIITGDREGIEREIALLNDKNALAEVVLGLIGMGKVEEAERLAEKYLSGVDSPYVLYVKGILLEKKGLYREALPFYRQAYSLKPEDPYLGYAYGRILEIMGMEEKALAVYRQVISLEGAGEELKRIVEERIQVLR
ncbi:MAG: hypothetical protein GXN94_03925 [Aquificae bacterium]|nr:hypothetical protein [Aquificota bacterium]